MATDFESVIRGFESHTFFHFIGIDMSVSQIVIPKPIGYWVYETGGVGVVQLPMYRYPGVMERFFFRLFFNVIFSKRAN